SGAKTVAKSLPWRKSYDKVVSSEAAAWFAGQLWWLGLGRFPVSVRALASHLGGLGRRMVGGAAAVVWLAGGWCGPAAAAAWLEENTYLWGPRFDSQIPACDNSWALNTIQRRFATKEGRFWNSNLTIETIDQVQEIAFRPWADGT